jgi:hypothetical protein
VTWIVIGLTCLGGIFAAIIGLSGFTQAFYFVIAL